MPKEIFIVGGGLPLRDQERLMAHLGLLESEIAKQVSVHIVDSMNDIPKGASGTTVIVPSEQISSEEKFRREVSAPVAVELKIPEVEMLAPMGYYNDGKANRRKRREEERKSRKKGYRK